MYKDIAIELVLGFLTLLVVLKLLGKIQFSQVTPFDFITAMVMGNFVGDAIFSNKIGIKEILFSIVIWGLLIYFVEFLTQKSSFLRIIFEGTPTILIKRGQLLYKHLKKNNMDLNQLQHLMRKQGYFSLYEAEYVILESDGQISIAPKHKFGTPTNQDMNIPEKSVNLSFAIIIDGQIDQKNLKGAGFNEDWLKKQLAQRKIKDYKEVFYAEWQENRGLNLTTYSTTK